MSKPVDTVALRRTGHGPEILMVHGGASPAATWKGLERLAQRWTLAIVYRRGFDPSPPPSSGRQDYDEDATDLAPLLDNYPHLIAHSYGAVGAVIAAIRDPARVRSLTLIEPALHLLDDPDTARFKHIAESFLTNGLDTDPPILREFLHIAGSPVPAHGPLPDHVVNAVRRARGSRSPFEARPPLRRLRTASIPSLIASGGHANVIERNANAVADELGAQRIIAPGAGHFVAAAPGFATQLEAFLVSVEQSPRGHRNGRLLLS
jgi:pimeloyl-ACP methyl ester carboxylesterase